jgi:hypothetical protein
MFSTADHMHPTPHCFRLQARLFSRLRHHHQERERLRLIVTYRKQFLDALLRKRSPGAAKSVAIASH